MVIVGLRGARTWNYGKIGRYYEECGEMVSTWFNLCAPDNGVVSRVEKSAGKGTTRAVLAKVGVREVSATLTISQRPCLQLAAVV